MEKLVRNKMIGHLISNNLIKKNQHGFVYSKSCQTLLKTLDIITESLNKGFQVVMIFLDFSKAFDQVSHKGLILKLASLGFKEGIIRWMNAI